MSKIKFKDKNGNLQEIGFIPTEAQLEALNSGVNNSIVTKAQQAYTKSYNNELEINRMKFSKQDVLVSGANLKTINNESLLGEGNIDIDGARKIYHQGSMTNLNTNNNDVFNDIYPHIVYNNSYKGYKFVSFSHTYILFSFVLNGITYWFKIDFGDVLIPITDSNITYTISKEGCSSVVRYSVDGTYHYRPVRLLVDMQLNFNCNSKGQDFSLSVAKKDSNLFGGVFIQDSALTDGIYLLNFSSDTSIRFTVCEIHSEIRGINEIDKA